MQSNYLKSNENAKLSIKIHLNTEENENNTWAIMPINWGAEPTKPKKEDKIGWQNHRRKERAKKCSRSIETCDFCLGLKTEERLLPRLFCDNPFRQKSCCCDFSAEKTKGSVFPVCLFQKLRRWENWYKGFRERKLLFCGGWWLLPLLCLLTRCWGNKAKSITVFFLTQRVLQLILDNNLNYTDTDTI